MVFQRLYVSVEWLKGETDEYETDNTDKRELLIRDAMGNILDYVRAFTAVLQQSFRFAVSSAISTTTTSVIGDKSYVGILLFFPIRLSPSAR